MRGLSLVAVLIMFASAATRVPTSRTLSIYVIDVEGGNATLVVSPSRQSLLIDTGHLNAATRDAGRIMDAVMDAGVTQIDHLITTHWHLDHFGGMAELAGRIPIREFIDHGPNRQPNPKADAFLQQTYPSLYKNARHIVAKPGGTIPVPEVGVKLVTAAGKEIKTPLPEAGSPNVYCKESDLPTPDKTENAQSIGTYITFGKFRALHLGDLSADKEFELMCPQNRIGTIDLFVVSHHGQGDSNTPVLVDAIQPRVAVMNNGILKGAEPAVMRVIYSAPGLENLWQLHFSLLSGQKYTVPGIFIANLFDDPLPAMPIEPLPKPPRGTIPPGTPTHNGDAFWIKVSAKADGSFTVSNGRTHFSKTYSAR